MIEPAERFAHRLEDFLTRRQLWLLFGWTLIVVLAGVSLSRVRPFWFDEIFTWAVAHPGAPTGIMEQLRNQVDQQPPPFFWLTRLAFALPINEHVAARLPGIFGFWLMTVCVFRFVQRRGGVFAGSFAVGVILNTLAVRHMVEARPYGLLLGFSALALVSWQASAEPGRGLWSLAGISAGVAGSVSSSYYGVLVLAPLACAELVRTAVRWRSTSRGIDIPVWLALGLGAATAIAWVPFAVASVGTVGGKNWSSPHLVSFVGAYGDLLAPLPLLLVAGAILIAIYAVISSSPTSPPAPALHFGWPETAAAVTFALIPIIGLAAALLWTNAYVARYVIETLVGIGILLAIAAWKAIRGSALAGCCLIVAALCGAAINGAQLYYVRPQGPAAASALAAMVTAEPADMPIVVDDPGPCLEMMHYGKPDFARRLVFLVDPPLQARYADIPYEGATWLTMARMWTGVRAEPLTPFLRQHNRFLLASRASTLAFVLRLMTARHAEVHLIGMGWGMFVYRVALDPSAP